MILENIKRVRERIAKAANRSGRSFEDITLVAVSKKQSLEKIRSACAGGLKVFGENYLQEAQEKILNLDISAEWHFIGHLQKNKIKMAVPLFSLIHTVDSKELASLINERAGREGKIQRILLQVKLAEEETKSGLALGKIPELIDLIKQLPNLSLEGLMIMPPFFPEPDQVRPYFCKLRQLRDQLQKEFSLPQPFLKHLSMGMSHDFEVAIEEGATLVRVGSAIFGPRT